MRPAHLPTTADLLGALRGVIDPELHDNVVDLGMVRGVSLNDGTVDVSFALTVASCPLRSQLKGDVVSKLLGVPGVSDVKVNFGEMTPDEKAALMGRARWKAREDAAPTEIPATTRVLAISSGKGGVGKSTTTANIAVALRDRGHRVGVLDADIWGFSIPRLLGVSDRLEGADGKILPLEADGIKVVSMGLLVDREESALMWRGLVLAKALEQFLKDVRWGPLDYLLVDMPPGTGDVQMGLSRMLPQAEMLVVTTPQRLAQKVAVRVADMARRSHQKVAGVVENMSGFTCDHGTNYEIFGSGGGERLAAELGVPLVARVPLDAHTVQAGDDGDPIVRRDPTSPAAQAYVEAARSIAEDLLPPLEMTGCTARIEHIFDDLATG